MLSPLAFAKKMARWKPAREASRARQIDGDFPASYEFGSTRPAMTHTGG